MEKEQANNPLHGVKLIDMLEYLHKQIGWVGLSNEIKVRCFKNDPSIKSSLRFLRTTPWAREKLEQLYLSYILKSNNK
jgi:uncharacterized protein (DUF2132 family)